MIDRPKSYEFRVEPGETYRGALHRLAAEVGLCVERDGDTVRFVDPTDRLRRQAPPLRASRATMTREQFVAQLCGHAGLQFIASS